MFCLASQYQLEDVIDQFWHLKYLQSVLKKFDAVIAHLNNFPIQYLQNGLKLSIYAQLDKKNRDLDNWQEVIERAINTKAQIACQVLFLVKESNIHYPRSHKPMQDNKSKNKDKDKDIEAKNIYNSSSANQSNRENRGPSGQGLGQPKKDSRFNRKG